VNELQAKQELSDKVKDLTQDRKDKEAIVATLRMQNSNLKKKSKEYENEIASLNSRIEELGTEEAIRNQKASNLNQNAEKELAALKLKLEENDKLILQLNSKSTQQMETISKKDAEIQKLKDYVKQLQEKEAPTSDKKELIEFDKVLFNVNGNKGSGSVKVKSIKADPALNLSIKEVHMLVLDIFENSQSSDLMIAMYKYLTVNRYEKTSYEIIPDASTSRGQSYKFKIVQPKSMTNDQFQDKIKAFNAILSSTTNYNDSYRLKNKLLK
jgi:predicted RNase H-like nuclease (RuvC/YqgF family)